MAKLFKARVMGMSSEKWEKAVRGGIMVYWAAESDGKHLNDSIVFRHYHSKWIFIEWLDQEISSSYELIQESEQLTVEHIKSRMKQGDSGYEYDSFALIVHGKPGMGARLHENNRVPFPDVKAPVDSRRFYKSKALISCGSRLDQALLHSSLNLFNAYFDEEKCQLHFTPITITYELEDKGRR